MSTTEYRLAHEFESRFRLSVQAGDLILTSVRGRTTIRIAAFALPCINRASLLTSHQTHKDSATAQNACEAGEALITTSGESRVFYRWRERAQMI